MFLSLFITSFVMSLAIQYASTMVNLEDIASVTGPLVMLEKLKVIIVPVLIISVINLLFTTILQHYIIFNPLNSDNTIFVSLMRSLKYFIPYLIIMVLLAFAGSIVIVLGIFVFVIGVVFSIVYVMTLYLFILPVMILEEENIGRTINRTIALSHRNFWQNMGWVAVFLIIQIGRAHV